VNFIKQQQKARQMQKVSKKSYKVEVINRTLQISQFNSVESVKTIVSSNNELSLWHSKNTPLININASFAC